MDPRLIKLAENLTGYSCKIKKSEKVLIECTGSSGIPLVKALIKETYKRGGLPYVDLKDSSVSRELIKENTISQLESLSKYELARMKEMDAYIKIQSSDNPNELGDIPYEKMNTYMKYYVKPVARERVENTKWVIVRYPNNSMAQLANTSLEAFEDFYFNVCNLDYSKMSRAMDKLVKLMDRTDIVHITGRETDLTFSIKDVPSVKCAGEFNIPDGEVFTAPVRDSVNGRLTYNCSAVYQGVTFDNISLHFKNGKIIKAESSNTERINKIFNTDEGARFVGEFSLGVNPYITKPIKDTLFDEKIMGSFHFTPGKCYIEANNGNNSAIHWDLVCIQTPEYGGGMIYFDDVLIRKDGKFVISELEDLNPENLK